MTIVHWPFGSHFPIDLKHLLLGAAVWVPFLALIVAALLATCAL